MKKIKFISLSGNTHSARFGKYIDIDLEWEQSGYFVRINSRKIGFRYNLEDAKNLAISTILEDLKDLGLFLK